MNRITNLFIQKPKQILSVFFTAGFPNLNDTVSIIKALEKAGADLIEIGMPFSDPVADGPTIQASNKVALDNGMSLDLLFEQLKDIRKEVSIPLILMGYLNPVIQYGVERFCKKSAEIGIDGFILPDLPISEYIEEYKPLMDSHNLSNVLLVTPQTSPERIRMIDENTDGFIYLVSSNSITGKAGQISEAQQAYFNRIAAMNLRNPQIIGFGIHNHGTFQTACNHANGAIIGSAFIRLLENSSDFDADIAEFVRSLRGEETIIV